MSKIKTYQQALKYIYDRLPMYQRLGSAAYKKDLTNTIKFCEYTGNPQNNIKTIHIAGTNGKGTTTHIIAGGLQAQGYKVGVYTSPHYKDFRERIKINGTYIPKRFIIDFLNRYSKELEEIQPSFFEMTVAMAFLYFDEEKVDFAVIETGLGGRLDSTNVIIPLLSVITNISFDHQSMLGNTLAEIAGEKAGIIKNNIPVIIGESQKETDHVFIQKAIEMSAPVYFANDHIQLTQTGFTDQNKIYNIKYNQQIWIENLTTDLSGPFQERNIITGMYALKQLSETVNINIEKLKLFFAVLKSKTGYFGRWQILGSNPLIIADSAHNEGGLKIILREIQELKYKNLHIIIGFVNDKELSSVLELFPKKAIYYFAKANIPRGLNAALLKTEGEKYGLSGKSYISVRKALAAAKIKAHSDDLVFIGGSIFVVAEVI
ncbi:MAG: Mur ligase family protein [Saprospiraceae bacterium]